ncbi:MAG: undecaprenyl-diphosphate phosphatase [Candidatus Lokiarchaeota archaeon]|nr:undecaprenyl-diphosphate phosphatase [Candidatus Lokiarchaeota archaeon]
MGLNFIQFLIISIIQALFEWIPVSSEGFVILITVNFFNETVISAFTIAIYFHLGTALAVLIKYWKTYLDALKTDRSILRFLIYATIGTAIIGIPLYLFIEEFFTIFNGLIISAFIGIALIITGTLLRLGKQYNLNEISMKNRKIIDELGVGLAQGFSVLPGISRSGTTMSYLLIRGYEKEDAFKMSFLISLPAVLGIVALDILKTVFIDNQSIAFDWTYLIYMGIVAVIGFFMMELLLRLARKLSFDIICYALAGITIFLVVIFYILIIL